MSEHRRAATDRLVDISDEFLMIQDTIEIPYVPPSDVGISNYGAGGIVEDAAISQWDLIDRSGRHESPRWADALMPGLTEELPHTPIEVKGCAIRTVSNRGLQRGRWAIDVSNHRMLTDHDGRYAFAVYDPTEPEILAMALVDAPALEEVTKILDITAEREKTTVFVPYLTVFVELDQYITWEQDDD